jgi:hypothetical protein
LSGPHSQFTSSHADPFGQCTRFVQVEGYEHFLSQPHVPPVSQPHVIFAPQPLSITPQ